MKYYIDTEFIEAPNFIELISIGIKCEDGRTFYAESISFNERKACNWVKENVISKLKWYGNPKSTMRRGITRYHKQEKSTEVFGDNRLIADAIREFINNGNGPPEFWGYYADYDWVVFCWLFGSMMTLPETWPKYCKDLKQLLDDLEVPLLPAPEGEHNALVDAIWNEELHKYLLKRQERQNKKIGIKNEKIWNQTDLLDF